MLSYNEFTKRALTFVVIAALVVGGILVALRALPILIIGFLCWIIAQGLMVPINRLRQQGMKRGLAVLVTFIGILVLLALFVWLLLPPLLQQVDNLIRSLPDTIQALVGWYDQLRADSELAASVLPEFTTTDLTNLLEPDSETPGVDVGGAVNTLFPVLVDVGSFVGNLIFNLLLIILVSAYLVLDPVIFYGAILALTPAKHEPRALEILNALRRNIRIWIGAMVLEITITAVLLTVALAIIGVPNAIALGLLGGIGNIVPYIGYWVALAPIILFAWVSSGPSVALIAFIVYVVIGIVEANIILPANLKNNLNIPAALTLLFQLIAGMLMGFWGVLLAMPILVVVMTLVREIYVVDALAKNEIPPEIEETAEGELVLRVADVPPAQAAALDMPAKADDEA